MDASLYCILAYIVAGDGPVIALWGQGHLQSNTSGLIDLLIAFLAVVCEYNAVQNSAADRTFATILFAFLKVIVDFHCGIIYGATMIYHLFLVCLTVYSQ